MVNPLLAQAFSKFEWGIYNLNVLARELKAYIDRPSIRFETRQIEQQFELQVVADPMPVRMLHLLGATVHQFRSSLDTAISTIVGASRGDTRRTNFPMFETEREFTNSFGVREGKCPDCGAVRHKKGGNHQIRELLPDLEGVLHSMRPWKEGSFPLWALNRLDNMQKHQLLIPAIGVTAVSNANAVMGPVTLHDMQIGLSPGERLTIASVHADVENLDPGAADAKLLFPPELPFGGQEVLPVMEQLAKLVLGILQTLEAHFGIGNPPAVRDARG